MFKRLLLLIFITTFPLALIAVPTPTPTPNMTVLSIIIYPHVIPVGPGYKVFSLLHDYIQDSFIIYNSGSTRAIISFTVLNIDVSKVKTSLFNASVTPVITSILEDTTLDKEFLGYTRHRNNLKLNGE